jgi:hypothetical protein
MKRLTVLLLMMLAPSTAHAEWLPRSARRIPRSLSASRDAPVFELAFGPRAQASIGGELGVLRGGETRAGILALAAFENDATKGPIAQDHARGIVGVTFARATPGVFGPDTLLEWGVAIGYERIADTDRAGVPPFGIAYGGGGAFVMPDVTWRLESLAAPVIVVVRLQDRIAFNAFPRSFGARSASDVVGDHFREGLTHAAGADLVLRWKLGEHVQPNLSLFAEQLVNRDDGARNGTFVRAMLGPAFLGRAGEAMPFLSFDAGNGKGALVNQRELRFSVEIRLAAF